MDTGLLTIDLTALVENWRALDRMTQGQTAAVVKANAYGTDVDKVVLVLQNAGVRTFFTAGVSEGASVRDAAGPGAEIFVFAGHTENAAGTIAAAGLIPLLNSPEQYTRHNQALPGHPFGIQLDSGMNRLGFEPAEWAALKPEIMAAGPKLVMSHLACADEPTHPMNAAQLQCFKDMTDDIAGSVPRSLAATGGILLGPAYHFDLTRPGIGLYGGLPFAQAKPVVRLDLPVIQTRTVLPGETVGYANSYTAQTPRRVATVGGGYADGILRILSNSGATFMAGNVLCPVIGRVSMDLITVDITDTPDTPQSLCLIGAHQSIDDLADMAQTIGYEILTSLGARYMRRYV